MAGTLAIRSVSVGTAAIAATVIVAVAENPAPGWEAAIRPAIDAMTPYKRPRALLAMAELPRNAMLKISRKAVREHVLAGHRLIDGPRPVLAPR